MPGAQLVGRPLKFGSSMADSVDLQEFVAGFLAEADEYLDSINRNLVAVSNALKSGKSEPRAIRELFRSLHTIKGLSAMVGVEPIVEISHEMEGLLRASDKAAGAMTDHISDLLVKGTRAIEERVQTVARLGIAAVAPAPTALIEELATAHVLKPISSETNSAKLVLSPELAKSLSSSEREQLMQAAASERHVYLLEFQPSPERAERGLNITSVREQLALRGELVKVLPRSAQGSPTGIAFALLFVTDASADDIAQIIESPVQNLVTSKGPNMDSPGDAGLLMGLEPPPDEWAPTEHTSIRVDIRRLDEAMERLSDLVITRSKLSRAAAQLTATGVDTRELMTVIAENARQLKRLRAAITKSRMVSIAELLQRLPLVIRGLTKDSGKAVNLTTRVGSAEVDKSVADRIFPAIVHLVRNAVDHAIESKDERNKTGKPETGELAVICEESSGTTLTLILRDDGRGISRENVARKAGRQLAQSNDELLQQITLPGLSTREDVTHTSGRGMGMDIVKRTVDLLGGRLSLSTTEGQGTEFKLQIPVSITIVDVLSFKSAGQVFAVPIAMVDEIIEIESGAIVRAPAVKSGMTQPSLIQRRGEAIPYMTLSSVLSGTASAPSSVALIINQGPGGTVAYGVDQMLGQQEAVVRPLDDILVRSVGMGGATDLGDGQPTLVLDLANFGDARHLRGVKEI